MAARKIKVFSHNDLDGFGGPALLTAVQPTMFTQVTFDVDNIGAGRIDETLDHFFTYGDPDSYSDVYIMDMTPDSEHTFKELNTNFANHWLLFDHHETEAQARQQFASNCIATKQDKNPSATSLVWEWLASQDGYDQLGSDRQQQLATIVELIRAYDTWDWQNDPDMDKDTKQGADELDQLFWFYPLDHSQAFVDEVFQAGWPAYRQQNAILIQTLTERRANYLKSHLKDTLKAKIDGHQWGFVYADDYKSEIAHELLLQNPDVEAAMVLSPTSASLRSNGKIDVAKFAEKYLGGGGHADAAGGRLSTNLIQVGEQAVMDELQQTVKHQAESQQEDTGDTLADNLDPEVAKKMAALFGKTDQ